MKKWKQSNEKGKARREVTENRKNVSVRKERERNLSYLC
jgi:hypothetical protein